jgi:hypothetical protein
VVADGPGNGWSGPSMWRRSMDQEEEDGGSLLRPMLGGQLLVAGAWPKGEDGTQGWRPGLAGGRATLVGTSIEAEQSGGSG